MLTSVRKLLIWFAILFLTAVLLGALGAHSLEKVLQQNQLESFETGVRYQFYAALALLGLAGIHPQLTFSLKWPVRFLIIGCLFFSGSIYLLACQDLMQVHLAKYIWPITPLGGVLMMASPSVLLIQLIKNRS